MRSLLIVGLLLTTSAYAVEDDARTSTLTPSTCRDSLTLPKKPMKFLSGVEAWLALNKPDPIEQADGSTLESDPQVIATLRSLRATMLAVFPDSVATPSDPSASSIVAPLERTLEITLGGRPFSKLVPQVPYARGDLERLPPASLDLLVLTEYPELSGAASVARMLSPLKAAMNALVPEGKLMLVIHGAESNSQFKRHVRAADALGLKTSAVDRRTVGARGILITR